MIDLFHIPHHKIDTHQFENVIFDETVTRLEEEFADFVGAKYAVSTYSATAAIFLAIKFLTLERQVVAPMLTVPSLCTTRFLSTIIHAGGSYRFTDNADWVGSTYPMYRDEEFGIIDSAQQVSRDQYFALANKKDLMIFSFYPTKPVGGLQGGMVVSNDREKIEWIRQASKFGERFSVNSWEARPGFMGWQMFLGSIPAYVALQNLRAYEEKQTLLDEVRTQYEGLDTVTPNSYHLYRVRVRNNEKFVKEAAQKGIVCGIHYKPAHKDPLYGTEHELPRSEKDGKEVVSIPFHVKLTQDDIQKVKDLCNAHRL